MLTSFVEGLLESGRVRISEPQQSISDDDRTECARRLAEYELTWRFTYPGQPPHFEYSYAAWAAEWLYRACQATVYRYLEESVICQWLGETGPVKSLPGQRTTSQHYSVDLALRFLPELAKLAAGLSSDDPLLRSLEECANQWPLSSVGMKNVRPHSLAGIVDDVNMLGFYADRIIARRDGTRLSDDRVWAAVNSSLAGHSDPFPEFTTFQRPGTEIPA